MQSAKSGSESPRHGRHGQVYSMDPELPAEVIDAVFKAGQLRLERCWKGLVVWLERDRSSWSTRV